MFTPGKFYVFFVPPGWLLLGKVEVVECKRVRLSEAAHLELTTDGHAPLADLPRAKTAKEMTAICGKSWPLEPGTELHEDGILISVPCIATDLSTLTRSHIAATIRGAR